MSTDTISEHNLVVEIKIPMGVTVSKDETQIQIGGKLGILKRDLSRLPVKVDVIGDSVKIISHTRRKRDFAILNTTRSIVNNMIRGVETGYTYRLKIVFAHFPINVKVKGSEVHVENIFGERAPRISRIVGDSTKVKVSGDDVSVSGPSIEEVSQTAANIESSTKIKDKDQRIFLDGLYIYARDVGMS